MNDQSVIPQYSPGKILLVWAAAAVPMAILSWVVTPALAHDPSNPGWEKLAILTVGLVWQFVLVVFLLYQEAGDLRWSTIRNRLWLNPPRAHHTGEFRRRLWWWLVPILLLTGIFELQISGLVDKLWVSIFPFLAEPPLFDLGSVLNTSEGKAQLIGNWGLLLLFVANALFNTVLGEELVFRGLLLPRMASVCGKWDWVMNGLLFGLYHLHQPWGILGSAVGGALLFALPSRCFRSSWFGIVAHSGQSIYFTILILGLVLGLG